MRQFDVYENISGRSHAGMPYVVVLQSHFFEGVPTVVVAPLVLDDGRSTYSGASIEVEFNGARYAVSVPELAAINRDDLRRVVGDLSAHEDAIRRALERVFSGFQSLSVSDGII